MSTYYVSTTGSDSNDGSSESPWLTINKAKNTVAAGDTIQIGPGTFYEYILWTGAPTGTAENPIMFIGSVDVNGVPTTIVDGSSDISGVTWESASGLHTDCYKTNEIGTANLLTLDGNQIMRIGENSLVAYTEILGSDTWVWDDSYIAEQAAVKWWAQLPAAYSYDKNDGYVYLRFANGSHPSVNVLRAPLVGGYGTWNIFENNDNVPAYITLKNLQIRGGGVGMRIERTDHVTVDNCYFPHGGERIMVGANNYTNIKNCKFYSEFAGTIKNGQWVNYPAPNDDIALAEFTRGLFKAWAAGNRPGGNDGILWFNQTVDEVNVNEEHLRIENCTWDNINIGLTGRGGRNVVISDCNFSHSSNAHMNVEADNLNSVVENCNFYDSCHSLRLHELNRNQPREWTIRNCVLEDPPSTFASGRGGRAMLFHHLAVAAPDTPPIVAFEDCRFINVVYGFAVDGDTSVAQGTLSQITFDGCIFIMDELMNTNTALHQATGAVGRWENNKLFGGYKYEKPVWLDSSNIQYPITPSYSGSHNLEDPIVKAYSRLIKRTQ